MKKSFKKLSLEKQTVSKLVQARISGGENSYVCTKKFSRDYGEYCRSEACNGDSPM
ncbi:hypothetical protein H2O64_20585 [Kordia sp. YSTF-M3]|uniref:Bacteriocin n=1 Tax=Kordia aestuariivivens TaxID=2759037 RepID=A0ABR7QET9_9FLAO|nr:hypothetical protein [Kordia aestuariivivens]MBC8757082.1 hypothetical protein [Kordia aestuariivivens]